MLTLMLLALGVAVQDGSLTHVRGTEPKIVALIQAGLSRSATFRELVATLDQSDVIVYIEPKLTRSRLDGYLDHGVVSSASYRYLRIALEYQWPAHRLLPILAHELQHAVEVSNAPEARNADGIMRILRDRYAATVCGAGCWETQAAQDVQRVVDLELAATDLRAAARTPGTFDWDGSGHTQ